MAEPLERLEAERGRLLQDLAQSGDMRRGSITEVYRRCGKARCACADPDHPGHGPYYAYTTKVGGKTKTLQLRAGPLLSKVEREVSEYKKFRALSDRVIEVSEQICDARPVAQAAQQEKKQRSPRISKPKSPPNSKRS
jgi:hypothetical protein